MRLLGLISSFSGGYDSFFAEMRFLEKMMSSMSNQTVKRFPRELNSKINGSQRYVNNIIYPLKILNSNNIGCTNYHK